MCSTGGVWDGRHRICSTVVCPGLKDFQIQRVHSPHRLEIYPSLKRRRQTLQCQKSILIYVQSVLNHFLNKQVLLIAKYLHTGILYFLFFLSFLPFLFLSKEKNRVGRTVKTLNVFVGWT